MARKQHLGGFFVSLFLFLERSEKPFTHWRTHQFHKHTRTIKHTHNHCTSQQITTGGKSLDNASRQMSSTNALGIV
uniref:Putative secreted protein n=1 Tax=Anopheles darlingi TaxID=43151 RepID=A0A2M4DLB9_ANODA